MSDLKGEILRLGQQAKKAALDLVKLTAEDKNRVLLSIAERIETEGAEILAANALDVAAAEAKGLSAAMIDRLVLNPKRLAVMAGGVRKVAGLPDPVGDVLEDWIQPNGLWIVKKRVPIGTIGIIYESRPNVTSDAAVLCFKSGNATILRGGSEAFHSNQAIAAAMARGGVAAGMPEHAIQLIPFTDRESVRHLAEMDAYLDLIIPRGGKGLIETVVSLARMPVIKHYDGVCHTFVDASADLAMATAICVDAKCAKPSACNAMETLLVHEAVAERFLPQVGGELTARGVELRGDERTRAFLPEAKEATYADWTTEYLDLILAVKIIPDLDAAIDHINTFGSRHSDCIVTADASNAERFLAEVDSATVYVNASTRFTDGEEFGFGAEIGISTDKLHARGPMGLVELTSYKYLLHGSGQVRG